MKKDEINGIIRSLRVFFSTSNEPWGIRDLDSKFIFVNKTHSRLIGVPDKYDFEGKVDEDIPCSLAEFGNEFRLHDRKTEQSGNKVTSLEIHPFECQNYLQPWYFDKFPLYDSSGQCHGTVWHGRPVERFTLSQLNKIKVPTSLVFTPPSRLFSRREWEIIFYLLQTYSANEIANCLGLSPRSVANYVQNMFKKIGVSSKRGLIDYCHQHNLTNYIPPCFFKRSLSMQIPDEFGMDL